MDKLILAVCLAIIGNAFGGTLAAVFDVFGKLVRTVKVGSGLDALAVPCSGYVRIRPSR